jgi:hypothetical protein
MRPSGRINARSMTARYQTAVMLNVSEASLLGTHVHAEDPRSRGQVEMMAAGRNR